MPRAFDIVPLVPSVKPNAQGKAELTFSVSNKLNRPLRAKATPGAEGTTKAEWLSVVGSAEQDFAADGTQQVTVKFQAPAGTPPGSYGVHLLVATLNNPDEEYAKGPVVTVEVPKADVAPVKPFPWWILALVAGVLVIVGGSYALFSSMKGASLHDKCTAGGKECGERLVCGPGLECLARVDGKCKAPGDCETNSCSKDGICTGAHAGDPCDINGKCPSKLQCVAGKCLGERGYKGCTDGAQCVTAFCEDDVCDFKAPGENCNSNADCPQNQKCTPFKPGVRACLLVKGEPCSGDVQCISAYCPVATKQCSREDNGCTPETATLDCRPGAFICKSNVCALVNGQPCQQGGVCASNYCPSGSCQSCTTAQQCNQGLLGTCNNGECRYRSLIHVPIRVEVMERFNGVDVSKMGMKRKFQ